MMDEPSMGLAPMVVQEVFNIIAKVSREQSIPILLVEQNASLALKYADFAYIMELGKIVLEGPRAEILADEDVRELYLGLGSGDTRREFKNIKTYKPRKRRL